jgi:DNA-binding NarL/FixJ family response regulator
MSVRVVVANEQEVVRAGLRSILSKQHDIDVVGEAMDGIAAVRIVRQLLPDVAILDVSLPLLNGVEATRQIAQQCPRVKVIVLSDECSQPVVREVLRAGASGLILKRTGADELNAAITWANRGETYLSPRVAQVVVSGLVRRCNDPGTTAFTALSPKQRRVLQLLAEGKSNKEVAACLTVSQKTVETHRAQLMERLQIFTVAGLTKFAIREGLTSVNH